MSSLPRVIALPLLHAGSGAEQETRDAVEAEVIALFEERRVSLWRYLRSIGLSAQDGEEIVQEAFVKLCVHLLPGRGRMEIERQNLRGWVFRVAHRLALKRFRKNRRSGQMAEIDAAILERHADPQPTPEQQFLLKERDRRLLGMVQRLPERDRFCLHLRAEGLRYREIAEVLGISLGGVANSLARSIAALSEAASG